MTDDYPIDILLELCWNILVQICVLELNVQSVFLLLSTKDQCSDFNKRPHEDSRRDEGLPQAYSNSFEEIDTGHNSDDSRLRTAKIFTVKKKGEMNLLFHSQKLEKRVSHNVWKSSELVLNQLIWRRESTLFPGLSLTA